jgi:hypothetical protein
MKAKARAPAVEQSRCPLNYNSACNCRVPCARGKAYTHAKKLADKEPAPVGRLRLISLLMDAYQAGKLDI